jgi:hypothetical protein
MIKIYATCTLVLLSAISVKAYQELKAPEIMTMSLAVTNSTQTSEPTLPDDACTNRMELCQEILAGTCTVYTHMLFLKTDGINPLKACHFLVPACGLSIVGILGHKIRQRKNAELVRNAQHEKSE